MCTSNTETFSVQKSVSVPSLTLSGTLKNPDDDGVPDRTPLLPSDRPGGIAPFGAHVKVRPCGLTAAIAYVYGPPTKASARLDGLCTARPVVVSLPGWSATVAP